MSKDKQRIGDTQYFKDEVDDFVHRKPNPNPIYIGITLALMFTITILGLVKADGSGGIIAVVTAAFLGLGGYLTWQIIKANDDLLAGDFENALYAGGMNAAHEFTILVREDQNVVYISPGFAKYFKHDNKESSETLEWLLVSMNMDENAKQQLISAVSNKEHANTLFAFTDAFGFKRSLKLHVEPVKRPKGFYLIRAKKVGDEEDSEFERGSLFSIVSYIMEMLPMNCYIMNEQDVFIHTNQSFASMVGYSVDELGDGSKTWTNLQYGTNDLSGGSGGTWQGEVAFKNRNNKPLRAMVQQIVLGADESGNGGIKCGFAMNTDNKGSSEGSKGWQEILALSPVPFGIIDEFGKVLFSNASLRKITGRKEEELKDWSLMQTLSAESKTEVHELLKMVKDPTTRPRATPVNVEIPLQNNEVVATVHITPNFKDGLEEPQFMVHMIDTTEFKNLELRVVHSQKMQAVGQLAGGIAHDFNNLLTAMMGFCDLLLIRHPSGDPSFADIMQIKQNANRAANLVRQLLAFSRKQTLQPDIIDITEILAELSNLIRRLIGENIELKISHGRDIYAVKVDQGQFEQVVINLAVNGRDAMNDGGVLAIKTQNITIDAAHPISPDLTAPADEERITDGDYLLIDVIDTGHGIPADVKPKIFEPFFSTKEIGSGTGLGLATVYGIVKQTGGYIYVTSTEGKGTKFSIFLPRVPDEEVRAASVIQEREEKHSGDLTGAGTVLLVEDEDPVRIFSARALRNKGYNVLEADCGEAALQVMKEKGDEIDLIITDVVMPGINGPTMVEEIMRSYKDINVIFISGYAEDAFVKTYGSERKFNFLPKPYTLKQLAQKAKDVMDKGSES